MISFDEAVEIVRTTAKPFGSEIVGVANAAGRVLAAPVIARIESPRSDVSAMDGYALRETDLVAVPARLRVVGESFAGCGWDGSIAEGCCVRIFTGAPVPPGADRVVIQEDVRRDGEFAIIDTHPGPARHIRKRGSDFLCGDELLGRGHLLGARGVVALAAADMSEAEVFCRPHVFILSTGDELAEPGAAAGLAGAIPESVSFGVAALAQDWGAHVAGRARLRDDLAAMEAAAVKATRSADLVVVTGGASVGEKDFAKRMFEPLGLELLFSKVAMKPGKPVWLGRAGGTLVMGLPGNPSSALVTARLLLAPLLAGFSGRAIDEALRWHSAPLASQLKGCGSRETFHRARWSGGAVEILSNQDSSAQKALAAADVLVRQRTGSRALATGEAVKLLDF